MLAAWNDKQKEELFAQIIRLYDLTGELVDRIDQPHVVNREQQLEAALPLIESVTGSTDRITELYTYLAKEASEVTAEDRNALEASLRDIFYAIKAFVEKAERLKE